MKNLSNDIVYSYSKINTFDQCPEKYKHIYIDKINNRSTSIESYMGIIVHRVLEWVYSKRENDRFKMFDSLQDKYDELWKKEWHEYIYI